MAPLVEAAAALNAVVGALKITIALTYNNINN